MICSISVRTIFFFVFYIVFFLFFSGNEPTGGISFEFQKFTQTSLKYLGNAHVNNNSIRLTQDLLVPNSGAGVALFNKPVRFQLPGNPTPASFSTSFTFTIETLNPDSIGGGLAFVISPNDEAVGDAGGYLGIPNGSVAIEFDTLMDVEFKDINGNHVGLDLNSTVSTQVADLDTINVNLRSGDDVNSWVEYSGKNQLLNISISHEKEKPKFPVLSVSINLNQHVNEFMFVGFAGSTQGSTEVHSVKQWSFTSSFDEQTSPPSPKATSPNLLASSAAKSPTKSPWPQSIAPKSFIIRTTKKKTNSKLRKWVVGILVAIAAFIFGGVATTICYKARNNISCCNNSFNIN